MYATFLVEYITFISPVFCFLKKNYINWTGIPLMPRLVYVRLSRKRMVPFNGDCLYGYSYHLFFHGDDRVIVKSARDHAGFSL